MVGKPDIVDAEFKVIEGPIGEPRKRRLFEGGRVSWSPWPAIGALALGLPAFLRVLQQHP